MEATASKSVKTKKPNDLLANRKRFKFRRCKEYGVSMQENELINSNIDSISQPEFQHKSPLSRLKYIF